MADRTILIAVDAGVRTLDAVRLGERFARVSGLPVTLATAFSQVPLGGEAEAELREEARRTLLELGGTLEGVELLDARVVEALSPARALHSLSEESDAALIVIGSTDRGAIGRVVPGTVAERLLTGAACPVAVAPAGYAESSSEGLSLIGVAYDGSEESQLALDGAAALASRAGARLRVITVFQRIAFGAVSSLGGVSLESVNDSVEKDLKATLDAAVAGVAVDGAEGVFLSGDAAEVLAGQSEELDLLVTGSRGYGPLGAVLLGGTTHRLLSAAACPVVVIPRGRPLDLAR